MLTCEDKILVPVCSLIKGVNRMNLPEWFSRIKINLVELASTVSLFLILVWLVWKEYVHLFLAK